MRRAQRCPGRKYAQKLTGNQCYSFATKQIIYYYAINQTLPVKLIVDILILLHKEESHGYPVNIHS